MTASDALNLARDYDLRVALDGADLLLEAAVNPPADVIAALKAAKSAIVRELRLRSARDRQRQEEMERREIVRWINNSFVSSAPGICCHCGGGAKPGDSFVRLFVGSDRSDVHQACWGPWREAQEALARRALGLGANSAAG
jgi:hypothetical protein